VILALNHSFIVAQQVLQLLYTSDISKFILSLIYFSERTIETTNSVLALVKNLQTTYLFVDCLHEFTESLEVQFEFVYEFFAILIKWRVKKFISYNLNVMRNSIFCFCWYGLVRSKLSFKSLCENIMLKLNDVK